MKFKIDYKSRKTIIAIIALIVLFAVAFAGGYAFIRSKDQSTAATNETITDDSQNVSGDENNQVSLPELGSDEEGDSSENEGTTDEENSSNENTTNEDSSSNGNTSSSTGTTATEDATTIIEQVVVGEKLVAEDSKIKWHPEELVVPETRLSITKSNLTVLKKAETQTSKSTGNNLVQKGETVTYTIEITNNGTETLNKIEVSDIIPVGTTFKSVEDETAVLVKEIDEITGEEIVTKIIWTIDIEAGQTVAVKFEVTVDEDATGTITNIAIANGDESQEQHLAVIETEKIAVINNDPEIAEAKLGDEITYTISIQNTGDVAGTVLVKDTDLADILEKAEFIGSVKVNGEQTEYSSEDLIETGINVKVEEKTTTTVEFTVKINAIDGEISNVALIGDGETPTIPEIVDTIDFTVEKNIVNEPANGSAYILGETVRFKVTITNIGSVALENVEIDDQLEGARLVEGTSTIDEIPVNTSVDLIYEYEIQQKDLEDTQGITVLKNIVVVTSDNSPEKEAEVDVPTDVKNPTYTISKTATLNKKDGNTTEGKAELGDTIHYVVKVINTGNVDLENITVTDTMKDSKGNNRTATVNVTVAEKEKIALEYNYVVTQDDINDKTTIYNKVTSGDKSDDTNTPVVDKTASYTVTKSAVVKRNGTTVTNRDENGNVIVKANDVITYTITVTNTGNVTLKDLVLTDEMLEIVDRELEDIEVGTHLDIRETYTVTQEDIIAQEPITNIAYVNDKPSNPVVVVPDDIKPEISKTVDKLHAEYGDILTYRIKIKSIAEIEQNITIEDTIDTTKVEFVSGSIKWDGEAVSDNVYNNGKITYETTISGVNEEKVLEFKVKVISINVGEVITNTAYVNKEPTTAVTTVITKEVSVRYDAITENPIDVILVLDTSGSMANNSRMTNLKSAAKGIVNILFPAEQDTGSTISLIKFSNNATLIGTYKGTQRDTLLGTNSTRGEIDKLSSNGGTNEYAALDTTLNLLQGNTLPNSNKIVIFLSDGAATTGTTYNSTYAGGLINENCASGYDNNTRTNIENKAAAIKAISGVTVYSVGLGIDSLATGDKAWVENCSQITARGETITSGNNVTFTVTVTNSSSTSITVQQVEAELSGVNRDSISVTNGTRNYMTAVWNNVTVPANSSITLTATATKSEYSYSDPYISSVKHNYNPGTTCTNSDHTGIPFTGTTTNNSQLYHYMNTKAWGTYTLSKIATSAATFEKVDDSNDVTNLTNTFANIIRKEVSGTKTAYADSMPVVIEIEETHTIIGDITVTIGDSSNTYTQAQLEAGVNGLVYDKDNKKFIWTINDSTMLYKELSLSYAY